MKNYDDLSDLERNHLTALRYEEIDEVKELKQMVNLLEAHGVILENMMESLVIKDLPFIAEELRRSWTTLCDAKDSVQLELGFAMNAAAFRREL